MLLLTGLGVLLLGAAGMAWIARRIASPIRLLHRRSLELMGADPRLAQAQAGGDELAVLLHSFELMSESLQAERRQRKQVLSNLEHLVEERTTALAESEKRWRDLFERVKDAVYVADVLNRRIVRLKKTYQAEQTVEVK